MIRMSFIPTAQYLDHIFESEQSFCQLYSLPIQQLDKIHWSPLAVIYKATQFLAVKKEARILDIGSGAGKFCLAGAYYKPSAYFYGVEQRLYLITHAESAREKLGRLSVTFMHKNFTQLNLKEFDGFYFYNSFFESIPGTDKIDDSIAYSPELYHYYSRYLRLQLEEMPAGTRVVTYCSWDDEIPPCYRLIETDIDHLLKFWEKKP
jgi:SAM-dependent methyltransferase